MKIKMLLAGVLSSLFFVACDKNDDGPGNPDENQETKSVFLKFDTGTIKTRSAEENAGGTKATLSTALIYFVGAEADPKVYAVRTVGGAGADATLTEVTGEGKEFTGIPTDVKNVYVVGNYNAADQEGGFTVLPTAKGTLLSAVESALMNIQQVNYPSFAAQQPAPLETVLYGKGEVKPRNGATEDNEYEAHVKISPINSRIEIDELVYNGNIKSFTLDAIFVNNYYSAAGVALNSQAGPVNNGSDTDKYQMGHNDFAYTYYTTMFDAVDKAVTVVNDKASMKPENASTWAYQVFGESAEVPHIVVRFTDIVDINDQNQANLFLTVKGFRDMNDNELQTLESGKVYRMKKLEFDHSDLEVIPEPEMVSIWVTVEVVDWVEVEVKPIV